MIICKWALMAMQLIMLGMALANHGKPKTGRHNFFIALALFGVRVLLLWGGGFFGA